MSVTFSEISQRIFLSFKDDGSNSAQ